MRKFAPLLLLAALPLVTTPAFADDGAKADKEKKEKKVCRRETATGSIMSKRVCRTAGEWVAIDKANEEQSQNPEARNRIMGQAGAAR